MESCRLPRITMKEILNATSTTFQMNLGQREFEQPSPIPSLLGD
jgi:hypothetical protein